MIKPYGYRQGGILRCAFGLHRWSVHSRGRKDTIFRDIQGLNGGLSSQELESRFCHRKCMDRKHFLKLHSTKSVWFRYKWSLRFVSNCNTHSEHSVFVASGENLLSKLRLRLFFIANEYAKMEGDEVKSFFKFLAGLNAESELTKSIEEKVTFAKKNMTRVFTVFCLQKMRAFANK